MAVRIKLPGGTLKMKTYRELRSRERDRRCSRREDRSALPSLVVDKAETGRKPEPNPVSICSA